MSYTYGSYKTALQTMVASTAPDVSFDNILPSCIDYAEQRVYRKLNLLQTVSGDYTLVMTTGQRSYTIPNSFVVLNSVNALTPAGSNATNGQRSALVPTSLEALNMIWPGGGAVTGLPQNYTLQDQWTLIIGPQPDAAYAVELIGTYRPAPLSATNTTTFLSTNLPDLFLAASMVFMSGYMRNFGAMASDPQQGMSWEQQYDLLEASAMLEEERKRYWSSSWSAHPPSSSAQPQRG